MAQALPAIMMAVAHAYLRRWSCMQLATARFRFARSRKGALPHRKRPTVCILLSSQAQAFDTFLAWQGGLGWDFLPFDSCSP